MPLPSSVLDKVEFHPATDIALYILRAGLPDVPVYSEIPMQADFPFILARRGLRFSRPGGDDRVVASSVIDVHVYVAGEDGDAEAEMLSEAVRVVMRDAWLNRLELPEGMGHIVRITPEMAPSRAPDWATAQGPVQYADLPTGVWRWESSYRITYRKPR